MLPKNFRNKFFSTKSKPDNQAPTVDDNKPQTTKDGFLSSFFWALICAVILRSFFFEPFHIPSSSMYPNLLIGDYIFVNKYSYGYSSYSFPFSPPLFEGRILKSAPKRGDIIVFRLPSNPSINYVKRLIGLPGDKVQIRNGVVFINDNEITKTYDKQITINENYKDLTFSKYQEILPEGKKISVIDQRTSPQDETGIYNVPEGHYFFMGDNRDDSQDSRFLNFVGYVPEKNLIGRASIIFFSNPVSIFDFWKWCQSIRYGRIGNFLNQ